MTKERKEQSSVEALKLALEALEGFYEYGYDRRECFEHITAIKEALMSVPDGAQPALASEHPPHRHCECAECVEYFKPEQEPVAYITPLMEQQMFDDWCPYKGNPDPRVVWAAATDAVNGLLLGATPPTQCKHCLQRSKDEL